MQHTFVYVTWVSVGEGTRGTEALCLDHLFVSIHFCLCVRDHTLDEGPLVPCRSVQNPLGILAVVVLTWKIYRL